jgi:hypothetical protein
MAIEMVNKKLTDIISGNALNPVSFGKSASNAIN